jgi:hypothetical protein
MAQIQLPVRHVLDPRKFRQEALFELLCESSPEFPPSDFVTA